jgi:GH15 family glucan-1,4-alpha-glucosidase
VSLLCNAECDVFSDSIPDYAQDKHTTQILDADEQGCQQKVVFSSENLSLQLNAIIDCGEEEEEGITDRTCPKLSFVKAPGSELGEAVATSFRLCEGQAVSFILRDSEDNEPRDIDTKMVDQLQVDTQEFWTRWIQGCKYRGRWDEVVMRSLFLLKMLIFEPTGAIVAAPTFSIPEDFGGCVVQPRKPQN